MKRKLTSAILTILSVLLIGCGGGGAPTVSAQDKAVTKIAAYATGSSSEKPSIKDYHDAGIFEANNNNINAINEYIRGVGSSNLEDWIEDTDGDGIIDAIDGAPDDASKSNNKPVAVSEDVSVVYETAKLIVLSASDIDGDSLNYTLASSPSHGTLNGTAPNLTYTPAKGYTGNDSFGFKVSDRTDTSDTATITIEVSPDPNAILITKNYQVESLGKGGNLQKIIKLGDTRKSLYILLSNSSKSQNAHPIIRHNAKVSAVRKNIKTLSGAITPTHPMILHAPASVQAFSAEVKTLLHKNNHTKYQAKSISAASKSFKSVGDSEIFYMDAESTETNTSATLEKVVSDVSTAFGKKTLNIWVSNDSFGECNKSTCVTRDMVNALADQFLKAGPDNDIYDWDTNIYGEEWGSDAQAKYSNLITAKDEITILLTDIGGDDNPNGGTMGYFHPKDNYLRSTASGSNERIMFYIDAVMFANTDDGGVWQKETYSTLAHEFQHMIHFYEKGILLLDADSNNTDTWINEMLSETTEDLVATKIEHNGPRNVDYRVGSAGGPDNVNGRYPKFNEDPTLSLTAWDNTLADYAKVSAFGTFLTRNYGGAKILHDIMHNTYIHEDAIMDAVHKTPQGEGKTFADLLREWGLAVILSDIESPEDLPTYNTGDFTPDTYKNSTYQLGSINFYNYNPVPVTKTAAGTVKPEGNYYYKLGDGLTGDITIDLTLDSSTEATLIAK